MLEPIGEVGVNFSLQHSSQTQFAKIKNEKVIAENQCKKHKKIKFNRDLFYTVIHSRLTWKPTCKDKIVLSLAAIILQPIYSLINFISL